MKKGLIYFFTVSVMLLLFSCIEETKEADDVDNIEPVNIKLPEKYSVLLRKEMKLIESDMKKLLPALVTGNGIIADSLAQSIHNGFILKQKLTKEELKELKSLLPQGFIKLDKRFHADAEKLSKFAINNNFKDAVAVYNNMTKSCVTCHSNYARNRFPFISGNY